MIKQKEDSKNCIKYMVLALNELETNFNDPLDSRIAFQYFRRSKSSNLLDRNVPIVVCEVICSMHF